MDSIRGLLESAPCSDLLERLSGEVQREMEVARLKETYSKDYLLKTGLVTPEEYDSIPASTEGADALRRAQGEAHLRYQVVGAEVD